MPVAHINLLKGHPRAVLRAVIAEISDAMAEILAAPKDRLEVWITEVDPELWGIAGATAAEALASAPRGQVEMPFVQMVLMEGRPKEQHHRIIAAITEILARNLGAEKSRIRVHIAPAQPDSWGIGGVPASVARAAELAARALAS
ncbi:tautomerase family protein [Acidocella sp.]|uniref:tautomerase family protein n=1 Tax=Acidocella sp. TaxID=50710 RepID=UPI0026077FF4|nr:tautomerase family protein [Acidocella sp.]